MRKYWCDAALLGLIALAPANVGLAEEQAYASQSVTATDTAGVPDLEAKKDELLGLLAQVDERYGDVAATLKSIEIEIANSNQSLDKLRKEVTRCKFEINQLNHELAGQVKAAYAMGQQEKLKLLLNQKDTALSSRMMMYYEYINRARIGKLANLQNTVKYLDNLDKDKQIESDQLAKMLAQKKTEQSALDEVKKQRNQLVARLNSGSFSEEEQLSFLRLSENKLIDLLKTLEHEDVQEVEQLSGQDTSVDKNQSVKSFPRLTGDFLSLKGKLPLPVRGKLGSMIDDISASENTWKGVLINAREGSEIRAITAGKVVYAGILKGYGLLVIIEHDNEFMTLYAFNQSLMTHKGDNVYAGDVIATVGQSGGRKKPALYFEIRQKGKPVDPLLWCRN